MSKKTLNKCEELIQRLTELKKAINAVSSTTKYTSAQQAAMEEASKLKKNTEKLPWVTHARLPNADVEVKRTQTTNPVVKGENAAANQLANLMLGKAMLGNKPPRQPTNEEMFGHLVPSEEQIKKAEDSWNNKLNWLQEAMKPIASKFKSPEEEEQYWNSIKIVDKDDGKSGF